MNKAVYFWGIGGVVLLLLFALYRLVPMSLKAFSFPFAWYHVVLLVANIAFMAYYEGYKGFQKAFSPRLAARARFLASSDLALSKLFAPIFSMAFYGATRRRIIATWILTISIVILIIIFQQLSQPLRGILDAGVVVGLTWGLIATVIYGYQGLTDPQYKVDPEIPASTEQ